MKYSKDIISDGGLKRALNLIPDRWHTIKPSDTQSTYNSFIKGIISKYTENNSTSTGTVERIGEEV